MSFQSNKTCSRLYWYNSNPSFFATTIMYSSKQVTASALVSGAGKKKKKQFLLFTFSATTYEIIKSRRKRYRLYHSITRRLPRGCKQATKVYGRSPGRCSHTRWKGCKNTNTRTQTAYIFRCVQSNIFLQAAKSARYCAQWVYGTICTHPALGMICNCTRRWQRAWPST